MKSHFSNNLEIKKPIDSGNIEVVDIKHNNSIKLKIAKESHNPTTYHWFYFQAKGRSGINYQFNIINANDSPFPPWKGEHLDYPYQVVASYDEKNWFRVPTFFKNNILTFNETFKKDSIHFATFAPYSYAKHIALIDNIDGCKKEVLGKTSENFPITVLTFGKGKNSAKKLKVWIIARQHPGETMSEWFVEGLLSALNRKDSKITSELLEKVIFYIIPNMNPDGSFLGNLRTNSLGLDLNRCWNQPNSCPEVQAVLNKMNKVGVDFFLDVHGEEEYPFVYLGKGLNSNSHAIENEFIETFEKLNSHVAGEQDYAYLAQRPESELMQYAHYNISKRFNAVSLLLEMPYKDDKNHPDEKNGWSSTSSKELGESFLRPLHAMLPKLIVHKEKILNTKPVITHFFSQNKPTAEASIKSSKKRNCCLC